MVLRHRPPHLMTAGSSLPCSTKTAAWLAGALPARPRASCCLGRGAGRKVDVHKVLLRAASRLEAPLSSRGTQYSPWHDTLLT